MSTSPRERRTSKGMRAALSGGPPSGVSAMVVIPPPGALSPPVSSIDTTTATNVAPLLRDEAAAHVTTAGVAGVGAAGVGGLVSIPTWPTSGNMSLPPGSRVGIPRGSSPGIEKTGGCNMSIPPHRSGCNSLMFAHTLSSTSLSTAPTTAAPTTAAAAAPAVAPAAAATAGPTLALSALGAESGFDDVDAMVEFGQKDNTADVRRELFCETLLDLLKGEDRKTALMDAETPSFHENDLWRWALGSPYGETEEEEEEEETEEETEDNSAHLPSDMEEAGGGEGDCYDTLRMSRSASFDCAPSSTGAVGSSFLAQTPKSVQCLRASLWFDTTRDGGMGGTGGGGTSPDALGGDRSGDNKGKDDAPMAAKVDGSATMQDVLENRTTRRSASLPSFPTVTNSPPESNNRRLQQQETLPIQWERENFLPHPLSSAPSSPFLSLPTPSRSFSSTTRRPPNSSSSILHQSSSSTNSTPNSCGGGRHQDHQDDMTHPVVCMQLPRRPLASSVPSISVTRFIDDKRGKISAHHPPETVEDDPDSPGGVPGIDGGEQEEQHEQQLNTTHTSLIDENNLNRHSIVDAVGINDTGVLCQNDAVFGAAVSDDENPSSQQECPPSSSAATTKDDDDNSQQTSSPSNGHSPSISAINTRVPQQVCFTPLELCPPDVYSRFALPALQEQLLSSLGASTPSVTAAAAASTAIQARASAALQTIIQLRDASAMLPEGHGERMAAPIRNAMAMSIMDFSLAALESRLTNGLRGASTSSALLQSSTTGGGGSLVVRMDISNEDGLLEHALGLALNGMTAGATRDMENEMLDDLLDDLLGEQDMMNWDHQDWDHFPEDEDLVFPEDDMFEFFPSTYEDDWDDWENGGMGGDGWVDDDDEDDVENWEMEEMSLGVMGYYGEDYGLAELEEEYLTENEFTTARRGNPPPRPIPLSSISPLHAEMFRIQFRGLEYDEKYLIQRTFAQNALDINENNMTYDEEEDGMDLDIDYDEESDEELYLPEEYRSRSLG